MYILYRLMLKYRRVIINALILIAMVFISADFYTDFFLGAAAGAVLIKSGEIIGNLKKEKNRVILINGNK